MEITFIVGCPRSGTSILGELIAAHSDVIYYGETNQHLWHSHSPYDHHRLTADDVTDDITKSLREKFPTITGMMYVDKTPPNILRVPFLAKVFPEAKFIHIIRDGRDVACSLLPGVGGDSWNHVKIPGWQDLMEKTTGLERCARLWKKVMAYGLEGFDRVSHLEIRYEELVNDTEYVAEWLFLFLGLKMTQPVRDFIPRIQNSTIFSYHAGGQYRWYADNHTIRVGRWKQNLDQGEQKLVNEILKRPLEELGYV